MIFEKLFDNLKGIDIPEIILTNTNGMEVSILTYGATIRNVVVPTADGCRIDISLGYDTVEEYVENGGHFGGTLGRFANRIGGAAFVLDGVQYDLVVNDNGLNCLHNGEKCFDTKIWDYVIDNAENSVTFTCKAADGEAGFPGEVHASFKVTLTEDNHMILKYGATTDKATPINMTNHWYFNLNGHDDGDPLDNVLQIFSDSYLLGDAGMIPTGEIGKVEGTPMDFRTPKTIGRDIEPMLNTPTIGYDMHFVIGEPGVMKDMGVLTSMKTGITMKLRSDAPGFQFYSGNFITDRKGKDGTTYGPRSGVCMETQVNPDAPNKPQFPNSILRPGEEYSHTADFSFEWK